MFTKNKHLLVLALVSISWQLMAQNSSHATNTKTIPQDAYKKWERINWGTSFSNNGNWLKYEIITNNKDKSLFIVNTKNTQIKKIKNASTARFSSDNNWIAYAKVVSGEKSKKLKKTKKKAPKKMGLINLSTNDSLEFLDVVNYRFSGAGAYLAMKRQHKKAHTLIVKDLKSGTETTFGNVKEYAWQDKGSLLALSIHTADKVGNAIQLFNPKTGTLQVLDQKNELYAGLKWRKESADLLVLRNTKSVNYKKATQQVLLWKNLISGNKLKVFDQEEMTNFPKDHKIEKRNVSFSDDGNVVYFYSSYRAPKEKKDSKKKKQNEESADVEIWNSSDVHIIPAQKKNRRYGFKLGAWNVVKQSFFKVENELVESVRLQSDTKVSVGQDQTPYEFEGMFGRPSSDLYLINNYDGSRKRIVEKANRYWRVSPNSNYFVFLNKDHLHLFDKKNNRIINITRDIPDQFIDIDNDHPTPQKPAFGFVKWSSDSKSFFVNSAYDVWQFFTNGKKARRITSGKEKGHEYRMLSFDRTVTSIDTKKPIYFSITNKETKGSGLASGVAGKPIKTLVYKEAGLRGFIKAKFAENMVYTEQTYTQSPNLFLTNTDLKNPKKISNTNLFQKEYAWGKAKLISYTNALGKKAQGILYYPANYEKGKKYPMITYIYEKLTQRFHNYIAPSTTNYYNTTVWTQHGYFVFNPDIEFIAGDPGVSSAKTLENAVASVIERGDVDAKKVGLIGHSWGGYQAGFVPTQTDIFAASVAGAGLTELISMNLAVTPAFGGTPENGHFEVSQERMEVAPWVAPDSYLRNSSVMNIEKLNTPILFEVGDNDQNVNWFQGIAYYNAARRAAKPFVLLVYAKEGHGLRSDKNRKDYQQRILTWFGHYLKGEKAADWVTKGIPYAEQQRRLKK